MQIRAITPHPTPHATLFLHMHTRTHTHFLFIFLSDEVCLARVQSLPLSQADHEWAEPCGSTVLIFHP